MSVSASGGRARPLPGVSALASNEAGLLVITAGFVALFWWLTPGFGSPFNLYALTRVLAIDAVIGFSMMVVLVTGGLNLAVGAIGVCAVMVGGWAMQEAGLPIPIAALIALAAGGFLGFVNGAATVLMKVHSFVVTLATMSLFFGAMIVLTEAQAFNALPAEFIALAKLRTFYSLSSMLYVSIGVGVLLYVFFHYTLAGRQILAAGANPAAARLSGVPVERTVVICHTMSGALAAFAGLMLTAPQRRSATLHGGAARHRLAASRLPRPSPRWHAFDRWHGLRHRHLFGCGARDGPFQRAVAAPCGRVLGAGVLGHHPAGRRGARQAPGAPHREAPRSVSPA
ncbi:MAG: ABC transporter permease [Pseudomonadota bacterium]